MGEFDLLARLRENRTHDTKRLMEQGNGLLKGGTSAVLFTPRDMNSSRADQARGGMIVLSPANALGRVVPMSSRSPGGSFTRASKKLDRSTLALSLGSGRSSTASPSTLTFTLFALIPRKMIQVAGRAFSSPFG